jgi:hypothetical protein
MARDIGRDRDAFGTHARRFWQTLRSGSPAEESNAETERLDEITNYWAAEARIRELVEPLLTSDEVELRYAAAAVLILHDPTDNARRVMEEISSGSYGFVSSTAMLFLLNHKI